jgi:ribosomal protein L18E
MPLQRRIPKRGFTPRKRHVYQIVNVGDLARVEGTTVTAQTLRDAGLIRSVKGLIKLLAMGEVSQAYSVEAHKFSGGAAAKIEAAGGSVTVIGPAVVVAPSSAEPTVEVKDTEPPVEAADADLPEEEVEADAPEESAEAENDG